MTTNETALQNYLIEAQSDFKAFLSQHNMPQSLSLHLSPDMCWISAEHEHVIEFDGATGERMEFIERKPPACYVTLVKI